MKIIKTLLIFICGLFIFSSCTIDTQMHINEDYSGSQLVQMDMGGITEMAEMFGGDETGDMAEMTEMLSDPSFADSLRMVEEKMEEQFAGTGISNISIAVDEEKKMQMGFDFADFESFRRVEEKLKEENPNDPTGMGNEMLSGMGGPQMTRKGKCVYIDFLNNKALDALMGGMGQDGGDDDEFGGMMESFMGEAFEFNMTYSFDRKIKKVKSDIPFSQVDNEIKLSYSLSDIKKWKDENKSGKLEVRLK